MDAYLEKLIIAVCIFGPMVLTWFVRKSIFAKRVLLQNKVVVITGASSGLGEACAYAFHKLGCKLILCSRREHELIRVKNELNMVSSDGLHDAKINILDLNDLSSIPSIAQQILSAYGHVDILINNGGMSYRGTIMETDIEVHKSLMNVNYFGHIALTRALLPSMIRNKYGHIVAVSSVQGLLSIPYRAAYSASKHACQAFYDCLRLELCEENIKVSVLSPGYIKTDLSRNALTCDGSQYNKMDPTTAAGMAPEYVAQEIVKMIQNNTLEKLLSPFYVKVVLVLRHFLPSVLFYFLKKRVKRGINN